MWEEIQDWAMFLLHGAVVGLHAVEISHVNMWTIGAGIMVVYTALSSLEAYHLRKKLKHLHKH